MADRKTVAGALNVVKKLLTDEPAAETLLTAADRAAAGRKAAELIKSQPPTKASEALGQLMEQGVKRTTTTQADRTRVGGGNIGGASFPAISQVDPNYAGKVWGVMDEGTAARLKNLTDPETAWTTMLGSANQLKTNPLVFDKLKRGFLDSMKQGNLSDELAGKINHNLALTFGEGADIRDPKIWREANTFEKRAALADVMMGQGTAPSKGGVAIGGEKSGKGVIFKPTDILKRETEPSLLHTEHGGDVPTFAAGPRLFRIDKESEYAPDLHPGFPTLLKGEDYGINMIPTPTEVYLPDWHKKFKADNPDRKAPGYYDLALGVKGEGLPSQELNDEYIRHLLREGFKDGGEATKEPSALDQLQAKIKSTIQEHHMAAGGGAFKTIKFDKGGRASAVNTAMNLGKRLFSQDVLPAAERDANLSKMLSDSKIKDRLYHGTTEDIQIFDPSKAGTKTKNLTTSLGTFLSNNPQEASRYAKDWGTQGGNVMPVFAQVTNPYQMPYNEFEGLAMGAWNRMMKDPSFDPNATVRWNDIEGAKRAAAAVNKHEPEALQDVLNRRDELIAQGHDAVIVNIGGNKEVIVFDPAKIKSAIGNRGTYDLTDPDITKAHGGLTQAYAGGGISTSAGSFSPEDVGMTAAEMNAPAIPAYVKQNASKLMDEGRAQLEKEYSQIKTPEGRADFIKRLGTALVGSPHDMLHMGLELGDYVQSKIPGMSKPSSVMLPSDTKDRVPKVSLADLHTTDEGDVYGGSSGFNTELKKLKFLGENEFPMMELPTMLFGPAVASKAGRGLKALASKAK